MASQQNGDEHLLLILDKNLQKFPLESMPCLRGTSTSRVPSFSYLVDLLPEYKRQNIDSSNLSFVLNPSGDLMSTQNEFQETLESYTTLVTLV